VRDDHRPLARRVDMPGKGVFDRDRGALPAADAVLGGRQERAGTDALQPVQHRAEDTRAARQPADEHHR
jgi:hypothetical protein